MALKFNDLSINRKFQLAISFALAFFLFRLVFSSVVSIPFLLINEALAIAVFYFLHLYIHDFIKQRRYSAITLVINTGILAAVLFFIISLSSTIFDVFPSDGARISFLGSVILVFLGFIVIGVSAYAFSAVRYLTGLKSKSSSTKFFEALVFFLVLSGIANAYYKMDASSDFINDAIYIVAIILTAANSLKLSWIAFLRKKQKLNLFFIAIVLIAVFGINFGLTFDINFFNQAVLNVSPGIHRILNLVMLYSVIYFVNIFFTTLFHLPTAEAFDKRSEEINSLMDFSKLITRVFDFNELADSITSIATKVYAADAAWLVTKNGGGFEVTAVNKIGYVDADKISSSLLEKFGTDFKNVIEASDKNISGTVGIDFAALPYRSFAVSPLSVHSETNGFLFAARAERVGFEEDEKTALNAYADYASVAIENARLINESIEKERLEKELEVAREIQSKILPESTPKCEHVDISALFIPAFEVGGDYYDFFRIADGQMGFVVADVSGKGIGAAFIMAEVKGVFESLSKTIRSPKELLITSNEILNESLDKKSFVTAIYGIIEIETGKVRFSRAGHTPLHLSREKGIERLIPKGMGLGLDNTDNFSGNLDEMEIQLNNSDILILYSDGVIEAQNSDMEEFGTERLDNIIKEHHAENAESLSKIIIEEVTTFSKDRPQHDDITLVIFKWN